MPENPRVDFLAAFRHAASLTADSDPVTISMYLAGVLVLPSGRLLSTDPLAAGAPTPFAQRVPPGVYRVMLSVLEYTGRKLPWAQRVALAMVVFHGGPPVSWTLATREGRDPRLLLPAAFHGDPVESGFCGLLDAEGLAVLKDSGAVLRTELDMAMHSDWSCAQLPLGDSGANVIAFSAGRGDGPHASWWGLNSAGEPVCLVTDFGLLDLARPRLGGDAGGRRARIRALAAELPRCGEDDARRALLNELGAYGGEAADAVEPLLALAVDDGESQRWALPLSYGPGHALSRICAEAPEQVLRVAEALAAARSEGAAIGLLQAAAQIRGPHARPLLPAVWVQIFLNGPLRA